MASYLRRPIARLALGLAIPLFVLAWLACAVPGCAQQPAGRAPDTWFDWEAKNLGAGAAFDLRGLNEKSAGDGGVIAVKDGRFIHSATGEPIRFWGVNGIPEGLKDRSEIRRGARCLAAYGVNLVRIHGGYFDQDGNVKQSAVERTIDVVEALKEEGIYSHLSTYFPLWLKPKADSKWLPGYNGEQFPFAALYFNKEFQSKYRDWWKALLTTPSAVTDRKLVDEPAVMGLEIINEDSYFFWTFDAKNIPDPELKMLEKAFGDWARAKYGSAAGALAKWGGQKLDRDNPDEGRLTFRPLYNMFKEKTARDKDATAFLLESQRRFYQETYDFLRGLGFKGVITCSNWTTADAQVFGPLEKYSYTVGDFIDRHGYFECNHKGDNAGWSIRDGHTYSDRSALRFDGEEPGKPRLFENPIMDPHYAGKPSMISETTFCRPNRYRTEAPLCYASYGALQASDAIINFAFDGASWKVKPNFWMQQWTIMSPTMMGQFPAAALIYRKGLIAPGDTLVDVNLKVSDLLDLKGTPLPQGAALDELRLKDVPDTPGVQPGGTIDPLVHYAGRTSVRFTQEGGASTVKDLRPYISRDSQTVTSTNKQLTLSYGTGILTIDAPQAQGLCGALGKAGRTNLSDVIISSPMELGSIVAVSLDGKPLSSSGRILLQVMSEERTTGFQTEPAGDGVKRITSIGSDPWTVRTLAGMVRFKRPDSASLKITPLDHSGVPVGATTAGPGITLLPDTVYYLVTR